ncbi:hypothetical protein [Anaerococcus hydrogenalis]|uniref:Uncharacterized protein n=2 Tax=Anaerococcus hydrogenalis TaxID=33029 RepID=F0H2Y3_9FIRM|nr:hypothetical protein [Anaerococcus hydrogenalis]EGC83145.1 hypothetical protein HMPREF9246_0082 [Anaerococcus hydrogenalis ACS-025-V-Sch4]MDK7695583.1 hypothetical protein [Anaerococcus hydrogenalis]MDK7697342.1 hypothetical protein [Anaerococcus hydrogenalis]MDK7708678.1 hypothetical protein [Anaerococcus hydrogenalis]PMC80886.1 hypothetical protein CJ192_07890 [Anaerococcus hydrogenalis]
MKKISKFFLRLASIYYLFISLGLFLISLFSLFVDRKYVFAIFDLLGFSNISLEIIKPISFVMLFLIFLIISNITFKIFKSIKYKENYLFDIFTGFFFIFVSVIGHVLIRDRIFIIAYVFNFILIVGAMLALKEKSDTYYDNEEDENKEDEYITFSDSNEDSNKDHEDSEDIVKKDELQSFDDLNEKENDNQEDKDTNPKEEIKEEKESDKNKDQEDLEDSKDKIDKDEIRENTKELDS